MSETVRARHSTIGAEPALQGAWFAAPPPAGTAAFRARFEETYGRKPPRVASLAYDALALQALRRGEPKRARRWIRACFDRYAKRAARGDKKGAFLGRQLAAMKGPVALAEAERLRARGGSG